MTTPNAERERTPPVAEDDREAARNVLRRWLGELYARGDYVGLVTEITAALTATRESARAPLLREIEELRVCQAAISDRDGWMKRATAAEAELKKVQEALRPFADAWADQPDYLSEQQAFFGAINSITRDDFIEARAAFRSDP